MENFKDFYYSLVENLDSYKGKYASFIDYGPDLFNLLCNLLEKVELDKELRRDISSAIAYYVVPMDVVPEQIYGPYGYIDDIYITVYVLRRIGNEIGYELLQNIWEKDNNIKEIMDCCYNKSNELLREDQINDILLYVGLKE